MSENTPRIRLAMLVDDDETDNFIHKRALSKCGLVEKTIAFEEPEKALEFLRSDKDDVDIIFLDINMPRMNGFEFMEAYSELPRSQQARTVLMMLSTSTNPKDLERARQMTLLAEFLSKPLTADVARDLIERFFPDG